MTSHISCQWELKSSLILSKTFLIVRDFRSKKVFHCIQAKVLVLEVNQVKVRILKFENHHSQLNRASLL